MRRFLSLLSILMLMGVLWADNGALAAETLDCGEVAAASTAGHFEGDRDEVPADSDQATPHHHSVCHGHCVAAPSDCEAMDWHAAATGLLTGPSTDLLPCTGPSAAIRPPIA